MLTLGSTRESENRPLLSLRGAAALLGLHSHTVRTQVIRGIIPGIKIGCHWRFIEADLVAWIRAQYPEAARMQLSALQREVIGHSTNVQASITSSSQVQAEASLDALLERHAPGRRKSITTD